MGWIYGYQTMDSKSVAGYYALCVRDDFATSNIPVEVQVKPLRGHKGKRFVVRYRILAVDVEKTNEEDLHKSHQ